MQKLYANQLAQQVQGTLAPCYLLFGEEPLQKLEAIDAIRAAARQQGYSERISLTADAQFDWNELSNELQAMSLFAERRLIELELAQQKLTPAAAEQLKALPQQLHHTRPEQRVVVDEHYLDRPHVRSPFYYLSVIRAADVRPPVCRQLPAA